MMAVLQACYSHADANAVTVNTPLACFLYVADALSATSVFWSQTFSYQLLP